MNYLNLITLIINKMIKQFETTLNLMLQLHFFYINLVFPFKVYQEVKRSFFDKSPSDNDL